MTTSNELIATTFQNEAGRVLAALYARLHDLELAEDALQDALVLALERWPVQGFPVNPGAWITLTAKNRAIDRLRRADTLQRKAVVMKTLAELEQDDEMMATDDIPDERLKLIFTCCHPSLGKEAQVALTLQTLGGLTTPEIASAFLVPEPTMAQRLVRAKRKIRDAGIPYQVPSATMIGERLDAVLSVLYLIFNAGYDSPTGTALIRQDLCAEAIRLARVLNDLLGIEPSLAVDSESLGLLALLLLHHSRRHARLSSAGDLILLEDQDRSLWDQTEIGEGLALLEQAMALKDPGPYQVQAAISALHAEASHAEHTDWAQIAALYDVLFKMGPSPVIALNRAVAISMAYGVYQGMPLLDQLADDGQLDGYYPFHAARADLLRRSGWLDEALMAYARALELCQNEPERAFFNRQIDSIARSLQA